VHYVEKFEAVKSKSKDLRSKLEQFGQKIVLYYDEATKFVGMLIKVTLERQEELVKYIRATYSNVQVFIQDNYMRLDFNKDGSVGMDDLRQNLLEFYDFLKNFDYLEASSRISSSLYDQAVNMMKRDRSAAVAEGDNSGSESRQVAGAQKEVVEIELADRTLTKQELDQKVQQDSVDDSLNQ